MTQESAPDLSKSCPSCGRTLVVRRNRLTNTEFWGCVGYPDLCDHTEPMSAYAVLIRHGVPQLPGFEGM